MNAEKNKERIVEIKKRLTSALHPTLLEVNDESHHHIGHAGAKTGLGHFSLEISAEALKNKNRPTQHRMIYQALGEMMQTDIHALTIKII